jgi:hypothetical protein
MSANNEWTNDELSSLYKWRSEGLPYLIIARNLNRTPQECEEKYNSQNNNWEVYDFYDSEIEESNRQRIDAGHLKNEISIRNSLDKFRLQADIIADKLYKAARSLPNAPLPPKYEKTEKGPRTAEHMGLILSDIHIGHEHSLEETGGLSEYNIDIFLNRMQNLQDAITDIKELHSKLYDIPVLHIFSLGDIVEGANTAGAWSPVYISSPIFDQVMLGYRKISDFIYYMLTLFERVEFYGLVGNHGRIAPNGAEKKYNNFDLFCYKYLEIEFRNEPRVKFHIPKTWWMIEEIQNHKFLMVHGDDTKGKNPPIASFLEFERKMTGITKQIPNYTLCGHFHNCSEYTTHNGRVLMNGSFPGGDVYSLSNAMPGSQPEQKLFGIHPVVGITWTYNINLNHNRS